MKLYIRYGMDEICLGLISSSTVRGFLVMFIISLFHVTRATKSDSIMEILTQFEYKDDCHLQENCL